MKPHYVEVKHMDTGEVCEVIPVCNRKAGVQVKFAMEQKYQKKSYKGERFQIWIRKETPEDK